MRTLASRAAAVVAVLAVAVGCSSTSPTTPGSVGSNLPAGTNPAGTTKTADTVDNLTLNGRVTDAQTGEGLGKVTVLVVQTDVGLVPAGQPGQPSGSASIAASPSTPVSLQPSPGANPTEAKLAKPLVIKSDKRGDFAVHDLPPGTYSYTAYKKGYEAMTFVGGRPASGRLDLTLVPSGETGGYELTGQVHLLNHKPAVGVHVAAALSPGLFASQTVVTDTDGGFTLDGLPAGQLVLAAWQTGESGEIKAWGFLRDVSVAQGKDKKTANPDLTLRAVEHPIIVAGKVSGTGKDLKPRQVQVFLETDATADISLFSRAPDPDGYYRFSVPPPEEGTTYHVLASAVDSRGDASYGHLHMLAAESHDDDITLPALPATPSLNVASQTTWSWDPMPDVSAYRIRLESLGDHARTLWEGWTTGTSIAYPDIPGLVLSKGESYRYSLTAVKTEGAFELPDVALTPWAEASSLAPKEFVAGKHVKAPETTDRLPTLQEQLAAPPDATAAAALPPKNSP
ncbi:MAG: hypothetical protein KGR26_06680 [Cyanobacteria bacterium REEB65]|nr:hypothetical protein [Cyanobacteria bacterium REEB65]